MKSGINHHAGSATSIDLAALEQLARAVENAPTAAKQEPAYDKMHRYLTGSRVLALIALARATPQHPDAAPVGLTEAECDTALRWLDVVRLYAFSSPEDDALAEKLAATPQHSVTEQASIGKPLRLPAPPDELIENYRTMDAAYHEHLVRTYARLSALQALAQPLASTAATQPEQASIKTWWERIQQTNYAGKSRDDLPLTAIVHHAEAEIADLRAALAIPLSTAASEQTKCQCYHGEYCPTCAKPAASEQPVMLANIGASGPASWSAASERLLSRQTLFTPEVLAAFVDPELPELSGDLSSHRPAAASEQQAGALDWPHAPGRDWPEDAPPRPSEQQAGADGRAQLAATIRDTILSAKAAKDWKTADLARAALHQLAALTHRSTTVTDQQGDTVTSGGNNV